MIHRSLAQAFCKGTLLVFREKHGTRYFLAESVNQAGLVCRKILKERHGIYWEKKPYSNDFPVPAMSREAVDKLSEGQIKEAALKEWKEYDSEIKYRNYHNEFLKELKKVLKQNSDDAINLVFGRNENEYERVDIEHCERV